MSHLPPCSHGPDGYILGYTLLPQSVIALGSQADHSPMAIKVIMAIAVLEAVENSGY